MNIKTNKRTANASVSIAVKKQTTELLSNSAGRFDDFRELGRDAAKGKLRSMLLFQSKVMNGEVTSVDEDAPLAVAAYSLGQKDINGAGLAESSQKTMVTNFKKFVHKDVLSVAKKLNALLATSLADGKFPRTDKPGKPGSGTGKDAFTSYYTTACAIANRKEGEAIPTIDEKFLGKVLKKNGKSNRAGGKDKPAGDPRKDAIASIDSALKVIAPASSPKRRAALAAFQEAFGIELHFWAKKAA